MADDVDVTSSDAVVEAAAAGGVCSSKTVVVVEDPWIDFDLFFLNASKSASDLKDRRDRRDRRMEAKGPPEEGEGGARIREDMDMITFLISRS